MKIKNRPATDRPLRITFAIPEPTLNGGLRVIACIAEQLHLRGHDVRLVATSNRYRRGLRTKVKSLLRGRGWPSLKNLPRYPSYFDTLPMPLTHLEYNRPLVDDDLPDADVVVATWWATARDLAHVSPSKGARAYFIQQYEANFDQPIAAVDATWRLPYQKIVCSQWLADLARDRFDDDSALVCPNGIDLDQFDAPPRGRQDRPTVGVLYSPQAPKSWPTALAAIIAARRRIPGLRVRVFAFMSPTSAFPLPADCDFRFRVPQDQLSDFYAGCDVWLCASGSEGFHLPPHEAMACRCPVVSTRVGGPMDMIAEGVEGHLVDPFDACALADRLVDVLSLPEDRWRAMSDAAYRRARLETWADAADRFDRGLRLAIERDRRRTAG